MGLSIHSPLSQDVVVYHLFRGTPSAQHNKVKAPSIFSGFLGTRNYASSKANDFLGDNEGSFEFLVIFGEKMMKEKHNNKTVCVHNAPRAII